MKLQLPFTLTLATALQPLALPAADNDQWTFDLTLYGLAAAMSGDVAVRGVPADVDVGFDQIWDNLEFGAMGKLRVGHGRWALTADVIYMGLGASKDGVSVDMDQWVAEPTLSYQVTKNFEALAGVRYNNLALDINGPLGLDPSGTEDWWDPIVGANLVLPFAERFSVNLRADIGGFGVGSDLTWQAFPFLGWQLSESISLQAGYRVVYVDYESGSGADRFKYDIYTHGPQVGFSFRF
jgi:hypothetical protein